MSDKCSICKKSIWAWQQRDYETYVFAMTDIPCHKNCLPYKHLESGSGKQ